MINEPFAWQKEDVIPSSGLRYRVKTADYILKDDEGNFEGSMFSYSYIRLPEDKSRPVAFAYNGGPGSDSKWVHLGFLAPKVLKIPGYPETENPAKAILTDNTNCLLDTCDIVRINPVGTAYTETSDAAKKKYFGTAGDADSFVSFICHWLKENGREDSPVYLIGESYGTIRNLAVGDRLPESVNLKGIIHIGVSFNVGSKTQFFVEPNVRRLGLNAAVCWYYLHRDEMPKDDYIKEAMDFAYTDYAHALLAGNNLSEDEKKTVADKLHRYTNLDPEFLIRNRLRFSETDFIMNAIPGRVISVYDARVSIEKRAIDPEKEFIRQEPFMVKIGSRIDDCMAEYEKGLKLPEGRQPLNLYEIAAGWDYASYDKDTLRLSEELLKTNPGLRMMFINGYYDTLSTFDFVKLLFAQLDLPRDRAVERFYESGHTVYIGEPTDELINDIRAFINYK